ncbi:MAG: ribonucleoside-diphosphate reductase subunit alpha [Gammaproteobacteria bacterium]
MHTTTTTPETLRLPNVPEATEPAEVAATAPGTIKVIRRNGKVTGFDASKIAIAMTKAFLAVEGGTAAESSRVREKVEELTAQVVNALTRHVSGGGTIHIEDIQDQVELALMRTGEHKVARDYVIYRERRSQERAAEAAAKPATRQPAGPALTVKLDDGNVVALNVERMRRVATEACDGLSGVDAEAVVAAALRDLYDGVPEKSVADALVMASRAMIEKEPNYTYVSARLLQDALRHEALKFLGLAETRPTFEEMKGLYPEYFREYIHRGARLELLDAKLASYDLDRLGRALLPERDMKFDYLGLQTLYDRYFIHSHKVRFELPQAFFMRVAMGLAINEVDREGRAIEFYTLLSSFDFMSSTPTLFNSGTLRPQLSSCYLTTVPDDLHGIFGAIHDNAMLSKFAGGLGNDWTPVRGMGAYIKGTNGKSNGVVPFMKVANDTAVAVNQCFAPDTPVYTANGVKAIRDVEPGELVIGISGTYREVTEKFIYNQRDPMVEIDVKHSIEPLQVTAGHPFYALRGVPREQSCERTLAWIEKGKVGPEWVDAGELKAGDYVAQVIPTEVVNVPGLAEDDARLYGILLGDGHLSKDGFEWGVSGNPQRDGHLPFVREYLTARGIHFWETGRGENYGQIHWASGRGVVKDATTGRIAGAGAPTLPFTHEDLYDGQGRKRIARRFSHLPRPQALALIRGLLETDGGVSRGKEIYFTNTSRPLVDGLRYQMLRLGVPVAGQYRERENGHTGRRSDGSLATFAGTTKAYDLRIPAVPEVASLVGCKALTKRNWITFQGCVYSRVRSVKSIEPKPFVLDLKVEGDESYMTASGLAHNGGKRKGAVFGYLETWHRDVEEFLDLRKNTGDDRRRTHDMNTANWVPDLFMKRVMEDGPWTLFSPEDTPDLHDLMGAAFEARYTEYERLADAGKIRNHKRMPAQQLWRKMLSMLFETGHPWVTFKDPCNLRSPQQHVGVVHSSNLCTEITLNTRAGKEIAVCNLGSVNLAAHITEGKLNLRKLEKTVSTAMRMLDNVIEYNYYSVDTARASNLMHRPVGLGIMGFNDALYQLRFPYESDQAIKFADVSMEAVSYFAIKASTDLAEERGAYKSFKGSLWSQGILPVDSIKLLARERGPDSKYLKQDTSTSGAFNWEALRTRVQTVGMRNSNTMAIAPTATIANITGVSQSIEPTYQNLYVKSNLSGDFTVINQYLVGDLKKLGLWDEVMVHDLKYYDGSVEKIDRIPQDLKDLYKCAFEVDARRLVDAGSRRQKWIDQAQSLNLYMKQPSGKKLDELYKHAWVSGLKTTYYLRTLGATHAEKTTIDDDRLNKVAGKSNGNGAHAKAVAEPAAYAAAPLNGHSNGNGHAAAAGDVSGAKVCSITDPDCEACQ